MNQTMTTAAFLTAVQDAVRKIDPAMLTNPRSGDSACETLYNFAMDYAVENQLTNTAVALPVVRYLLFHAAENPDSRFGIANTHRAYYLHCLNVCHMLIDLHIPLDQTEEDILLASSICHILPENISYPQLDDVLTGQFGLDVRIYETIRLIFRKENESEIQEKAFFDRIQENKLALLIKLADRGNLVEQLYGISNWSARNYIRETRNFFFPMCIYAKEHYPDVHAPISVMMEKMRCLIEVAEILLGRYEAREAELTMEILNLREENATLTALIQGFRDTQN